MWIIMNFIWHDVPKDKVNRPLQWTAKYYFKIPPQKQIKKCKLNTNFYGNSYFYHLLTNTGIIFSKVFSKHKAQKKMHKHFCFQSVTNSEWDFHWFSLPFTCTIKMHTIVRGSLIPLFVPKFFCLYTLVLNHYGATFHNRTFTPNLFHFCKKDSTRSGSTQMF